MTDDEILSKFYEEYNSEETFIDVGTSVSDGQTVIYLCYRGEDVPNCPSEYEGLEVKLLRVQRTYPLVI